MIWYNKYFNDYNKKNTIIYIIYDNLFDWFDCKNPIEINMFKQIFHSKYCSLYLSVSFRREFGHRIIEIAFRK